MRRPHRASSISTCARRSGGCTRWSSSATPRGVWANEDRSRERAAPRVPCRVCYAARASRRHPCVGVIARNVNRRRWRDRVPERLSGNQMTRDLPAPVRTVKNSGTIDSRWFAACDHVSTASYKETRDQRRENANVSAMARGGQNHRHSARSPALSELPLGRRRFDRRRDDRRANLVRSAMLRTAAFVLDVLRLQRHAQPQRQHSEHVVVRCVARVEDSLYPDGKLQRFRELEPLECFDDLLASKRAVGRLRPSRG